MKESCTDIPWSERDRERERKHALNFIPNLWWRQGERMKESCIHVSFGEIQGERMKESCTDIPWSERDRERERKHALNFIPNLW